jgi:branched-chain amino acid aminotransferase
MTTTATTGQLTFDVRPSGSPLPADERASVLTDPGFGRAFTDHMVTIRWSTARGWHDARLEPYGPITLDPASAVLHYGQEIFEGLKAYRQHDGTIACFRPEANGARMNRSARRMAMPELPVEVFVEAIDLLVHQDQAWVPSTDVAPDTSLYLRPFMFATEVGLGVNKPAGECLFMLIASPAGAYFSGGVRPVSVWLSHDYVRAAPGGTGEVKCGGNYAASFLAQRQAVAEGCDQVFWLDAVERRWVEEMGSNNLVFVYGSGDDARLRTPKLSGSLLPGITRDSLLTLAPELGIPVEEAMISTDEWREGCDNGSITEVFGCGTAAIITPIGHVKAPEGEFVIGDGTPGPVTMRLRQALLDIQHGVAADTHNWLHRVEL